ncbi:MAG: fatty acid desaturase [Myxococcales bacterium]|nr:fatty acid desaturase [Myxococcales bacterium]
MKWLEPETVRNLSQVRPLAAFIPFAFDVCVIAAAMFLGSFFSGPLVYLLTIVVIGSRQATIIKNTLHDGVHGLLHPDRKLNDAIAKYFILPVFLFMPHSFDAWRHVHLLHHSFSGTPEDPELQMRAFQASRWKIAGRILINLSGLRLIIDLADWIFRGTWFSRIFAVAFTTSMAVGLVEANPVALFVAVFWVVPRFTWMTTCLFIYMLAEHYLPEEGYDFDDPFRTREVIQSWFDALFVMPHGHWHLTHHLFPSVPFHNLGRARAELQRSEDYVENAYAIRGYHNVLVEVFTRKHRGKIPGAATVVP